MVAQRRDAEQPRPAAQFSLQGLLLFVLACAVYFAMLSAVARMFFGNYEEAQRRRVWQALATIPTAWFVLWLLYRHWGLRHALIVHYSGPLMAAALTAILAVPALLEIASRRLSVDGFVGGLVDEALPATLAILLIGCGMSNLVSLPAAVVVMLRLAGRGRGNWRE